MTQKAKQESKRAVGTFYEEAAVRYLKDQGYEILCRNFSCRQGEIDIVAREGEYLCFVEVKYRSTEGFGDGLAAVDRKKQQRISRTALYYLTKQGYGMETPCRFDVVGITPKGVKLIKNAFEFRG